MQNLKDIQAYLVQKKCKDIALYDASGEMQDFDYIFVVTLSNVTNNKKFAFNLARELGFDDMPEGYNKGEWIIFDLGQIVIHSFIPNTREKYNLDKLWKNKKLILD